MINTINDIVQSKYNCCDTDGGTLIPVEHDFFETKRVFVVKGIPSGNTNRGNHAHKNTKQLLVCLSGSLTVVCDDGKSTTAFDLKEPGDCVYIPNQIWDSQIYRTKNTELLVLSSELYNNRYDYINDYNEFLEYRKSLNE